MGVVQDKMNKLLSLEETRDSPPEVALRMVEKHCNSGEPFESLIEQSRLQQYLASARSEGFAESDRRSAAFTAFVIDSVPLVVLCEDLTTNPDQNVKLTCGPLSSSSAILKHYVSGVSEEKRNQGMKILLQGILGSEASRPPQLLFHATNALNVCEIVRDGISLHRQSEHLDFSPEGAFYFAEHYSDSFEWAVRKKGLKSGWQMAAILVYKVPDSFRVYELTSTDEWNHLVRLSRTRLPGGALLDKRVADWRARYLDKNVIRGKMVETFDQKTGAVIAHADKMQWAIVNPEVSLNWSRQLVGLLIFSLVPQISTKIVPSIFKTVVSPVTVTQKAKKLRQGR